MLAPEHAAALEGTANKQNCKRHYLGISLIWVWTGKTLFHSNTTKESTQAGPVHWNLNRSIFWEGVKDNWIFIILTIWSELFLINLFSIHRLTELLLVPQSQVFTPSFQAMFQTKLKNFSSLCRITLCPGQLFQENAPGLLQTDRDVYTPSHMCSLSCFLPQMKLVVCVNGISCTPLQPWCSRDGDLDALQQAAFAD